MQPASTSLIVPADGASTPEAVRLALCLPRNKFSDADLLAISRLRVEAREDMMRWHRLLEGLMPVSGRVRVQGITACLHKIARREGADYQKVRRRYDAFRKNGWRGLVNRSLAGPTWYERNVVTQLSVAERPAFIDFWRSVMEIYQGRDDTGQAAHRALVRQLEAWEHGDASKHIPGYDLPPARDAFTLLPPGWSYENLMKYKPGPDELAAAKYGRGALSQFRLPVLSTREGLKVGQVVFFDDQDYDLNVNFLGVARHDFRPCGFDAQDCLSAKQPLHGFKPVLVDDTTGKRRKLLEIDFRWFVVAYLTTVGYRPDTGTVLIVEHGTAAIRNTAENDFEDRIFRATNGLVKVDRGGIAGQPVHAGMFEGQPRGNFKFKASLESARVRLRNNMADLPGAVGKDRDHAPEGEYGAQRYNQKLLNASQLNPALAALLQFPRLDWRQFVEATLEYYRLDDTRTEHDLEGWERCGHIVHEYRLTVDSQQWIDARESFAAMTNQQREAVCALVESKQALWRTRKMSPQEVWDAGKGELVVVPDHALALLMGPSEARTDERCENNGLFIVKDKALDAEPMHYDASALIQQGCVERGGKYSVYLNPFAPQRLVVCDAALRYLGTAHLWDRIKRLDKGEAVRRIAHARQQEALPLENLSRRGAKQTRRMVEMRTNNAAVLTGRAPAAPLPPETVHQDDEQARRDDEILFGNSSRRPRRVLPPNPNPPPKTQEAEGDDLDLLN